MNRYIALLRGINVGGHRKLKMEALRDLFSEMGFEQVRSYIQSGNVVFHHEPRLQDTSAHEIRVSERIKEKFGYEVPVLIRPDSYLDKIVSENPFTEDMRQEGHKLYLTFLSGVPAPEDAEYLEAYKAEGESFMLKGRALYLLIDKTRVPVSRQIANNATIEKVLKVRATNRNWNTVLKLQAMCHDLSRDSG